MVQKRNPHYPKRQKYFFLQRRAGIFRKHGEKLNVKQIDASVYHYGWVKPPEAQQAKQKSFHKMWHDDTWMKENVADTNEFDYSQIEFARKIHRHTSSSDAGTN